MFTFRSSKFAVYKLVVRNAKKQKVYHKKHSSMSPNTQYEPNTTDADGNTYDCVNRERHNSNLSFPKP